MQHKVLQTTHCDGFSAAALIFKVKKYPRNVAHFISKFDESIRNPASFKAASLCILHQSHSTFGIKVKTFAALHTKYIKIHTKEHKAAVRFQIDEKHDGTT